MSSTRIQVFATLACLAVAMPLFAASQPARSTAPAATLGAAPAAHTGRILIVPVHEEIDRIQGAYLHRVLSGARGNYAAVIFDIDTPGGRLDIMAEMSREITELSPTPTIAFVTKWAASAGSFIAMSCDRIYMTPNAVIGAAHVVLSTPDGAPAELPKSVEEKYTSFGRAEFRALAQAKGYPVAIAEGMVDENIGVTQARLEGKIVYLTNDELDKINADPLRKERLTVIKTIVTKGKLVTLTANEAVEYDVARKVVKNLDELLALPDVNLAGCEQVRRGQNWSDEVIGILTYPQVISLLILIGFAGIWLEMKAPGFGVPGTIAVIAFVLVFAAQFLVGNANAVEILLFIVGLVLLFIEIFVTPGFGFMGALGIAFVFAALLLSMQPFVIPTAPWQVEVFKVNLLATLGGVAGSFLVLLIAIWFFPSTPFFERLALKSELVTPQDIGTGSSEGQALVGQVGVVVTTCRPAGKMQIGDQVYSVSSDSEFVLVGRRARVIAVDGPRIVVEPVPVEPTKEPEFKA